MLTAVAVGAGGNVETTVAAGADGHVETTVDAGDREAVGTPVPANTAADAGSDGVGVAHHLANPDSISAGSALEQMALNVVCTQCRMPTTIAKCRVIAKRSQTWRCSTCHSKITMLQRHYGRWPTQEWLQVSAEDQLRFWRTTRSSKSDVVAKSTAEIKKVMRKTKFGESKGSFLPLSVHARQGFDITAIQERTPQEDRMMHPVLGECYRVAIVTAGSRAEEEDVVDTGMDAQFDHVQGRGNQDGTHSVTGQGVPLAIAPPALGTPVPAAASPQPAEPQQPATPPAASSPAERRKRARAAATDDSSSSSSSSSEGDDSPPTPRTRQRKLVAKAKVKAAKQSKKAKANAAKAKRNAAKAAKKLAKKELKRAAKDKAAAKKQEAISKAAAQEQTRRSQQAERATQAAAKKSAKKAEKEVQKDLKEKTSTAKKMRSLVDPHLKDFADLLDHALAQQFPEAVKLPAHQLRATFAAVKSACQLVEVNASNPLPDTGLAALKAMANDAKKKTTVLKTMLRTLTNARRSLHARWEIDEMASGVLHRMSSCWRWLFASKDSLLRGAM